MVRRRTKFCFETFLNTSKRYKINIKNQKSNGCAQVLQTLECARGAALPCLLRIPALHHAPRLGRPGGLRAHAYARLWQTLRFSSAALSAVVIEEAFKPQRFNHALAGLNDNTHTHTQKRCLATSAFAHLAPPNTLLACKETLVPIELPLHFLRGGRRLLFL